MKVAFGQRDLKEERVPANQTSGERGSQERERQRERPEGANSLCVFKVEQGGQ